MRALLAATVVLLGCQDRMAPGSSPAPTEPSPPPREVTERPPVAEVDLGMARFIRRNPDSLEVSPLRVSGFAVRIDDLGGVARTTIEVEIGNDSGAVAEAVVQIPLSPGAAVVGGALWVGGDSVPAVFAPAEAADDQSGAPRRYPMSVSWERGAVLIEIYPMPAKGTRRFELTWVEAIGDGSYRLPVLANDGQVVAVANPVEVDGKPATVRDGLVTLGAAPAIVRVRRDGEQSAAYQLTSGPRAPGGLVVVTETGVETSDAERRWQSERLSAVLELIPETTVTVLAADWLVEPIAVASKAKDVRIERLNQRRRAGLLDVESALERALELAKAIGAGSVVWVGTGSSQLAMRGRSAWLSRLADEGLQLLRIEDAGRESATAAATSGRPGPWNRSGSGAESVGAAAVRVDRDPDPRTRWVLIPSASGAPVWISRTEGKDGDQTGDLTSAVEALWVRASFTRPLLYQQALKLPTQVVGPEASLVAVNETEDFPKNGLSKAPIEAGEPAPASTRRRRRRRPPKRPWFPRPQVVVAAPVVSGDEPDRIEAELKRGQRRLLKCFRRHLAAGNAGGQALVRFQIFRNGRPSFPRAKGIKEPALVSCLHDWLYPKRFGLSKQARSVELGVGFQSNGLVEWKEAIKRIEAGESAARVEQAIAGLIPGKSGPELWWALWQPMRKGGYFGSHCRVIPWLFKEADDRKLARRLLSECARDFRRATRKALMNWKQAEDLPRVERVLRPGSGRGRRR